ncbi:MAG: YncE family protein [Fimbriimonadales bacterium]
MMIQFLLALSSLSMPSAELVADAPIAVPGGPGHFDFMNIDPVNGFVFACHPGKSSFTVVNLATHEVKDISADVACNGIGVDSAGKRVFAAGPGKTLVCFDTQTWTKTGTLALDGPGDCVQFDAKRGVVYVDNDDGTNLWIVDPATMKLKGSVTIKEAPEYMEYDRGRDRIFQAIKSTSTVQVIDPASGKVLAEWSLGDLTSPHGLAIDRKAGRAFLAGKNGKLDILDMKSGKILNVVEIVKGSDQIAYDQGLKRLYIPGESKIQIVQITGDTGSVVGDVPVGKDCHRIAIDPKSHDVWVAFSDATNSYVQRFAAK